MKPRAHILDALTLYCTACGQAFRDINANRAFLCRATPNVVAISHRVRPKRLAQAVRQRGFR